MSEETKKQPETEQEQAAAETKAPAAESRSKKMLWYGSDTRLIYCKSMKNVYW